MTTPVSGVTVATGTNSATAAQVAADAAKSTALDPQAFLQLLVAQLQYQDPTSPVDTSSFMQQTATLSQVQTMSSMSTSLTSLVSAQQAQAATSMIGKTVTYMDATGARTSGVVSAAELTATGATLKVGSASVPLSNVVEVTAASNGA